MTIPMIYDTFSVDQKIEMYKINGRILSGEAAKLIINEAIKKLIYDAVAKFKAEEAML